MLALLCGCSDADTKTKVEYSQSNCPARFVTESFENLNLEALQNSELWSYNVPYYNNGLKPVVADDDCIAGKQCLSLNFYGNAPFYPGKNVNAIKSSLDNSPSASPPNNTSTLFLDNGCFLDDKIIYSQLYIKALDIDGVLSINYNFGPDLYLKFSDSEGAVVNNDKRIIPPELVAGNQWYRIETQINIHSGIIDINIYKENEMNPTGLMLNYEVKPIRGSGWRKAGIAFAYESDLYDDNYSNLRNFSRKQIEEFFDVKCIERNVSDEASKTTTNLDDYHYCESQLSGAGWLPDFCNEKYFSLALKYDCFLNPALDPSSHLVYLDSIAISDDPSILKVGFNK